jgi:hypothetical protein
MNPTLTDITEALAALQADEELGYAIAESDHPAAKRYMRWLCHECLPAVRRGGYDWPYGQDEFDRMIREAVNAVRPIQ